MILESNHVYSKKPNEIWVQYTLTPGEILAVYAAVDFFREICRITAKDLTSGLISTPREKDEYTTSQQLIADSETVLAKISATFESLGIKSGERENAEAI